MVGEWDLVFVFELHEPGHRIRAGAIHADLPVVIHGHEGERRIQQRIHDANVQAVNAVDGLPVGQGSASQGIDAKLESGAANRVDINDVPQIAYVRQDEVFLVRGRGADGSL